MSVILEKPGRQSVVVITGASAGVGRAAALSFAKRGWRVALIARGNAGLQTAAREVEKAGGTALTLTADVANPTAIMQAADRVVTEWGDIDIWVNNAMATIFAPIDDITPGEFKRVTEVTYLGQVHGTLAALKHMRRQNSGTIVQVGSALAYRSVPLQAAYCAAKAAVRAFTDGLRSELIHQRSPIRTTMVHLPAINTPQFNWARSRLPRKLRPVSPIYDPELAAESIYNAAQYAPRELWVGKTTLQAILGTMVVPGILDRSMARRAWDGQMTDEPAAERADNLFQPMEAGYRITGRFTDMSRHAGVTISASLVRAVAAAVGFALAAAVGILIDRQGRSGRGQSGGA